MNNRDQEVPSYGHAFLVVSNGKVSETGKVTLLARDRQTVSPRMLADRLVTCALEDRVG